MSSGLPKLHLLLRGKTLADEPSQCGAGEAVFSASHMAPEPKGDYPPVNIDLDQSRQLSGLEIESGLRILEKEKGLLPTQRQDFLYWLLNLWLGVFALIILAYFISLKINLRLPLDVVVPVFGVFGLVSVLLFLSNIPLMRKLLRHTWLRYRLGLTGAFRSALKQRKSRMREKPLSAILYIVSALLSVGVVISLVSPNALDPLVAAFVLLFNLLLILSFASLAFMQYARKKLGVVQTLIENLQNLAVGSQGRTEVARAVYTRIAALEQDQILRERLYSLSRVRMKEELPKYSLQHHRSVAKKKKELNSEDLVKIERLAYQLAEDAKFDVLAAQKEGGLKWIEVTDTSYCIGYRRDEDKKRVQILSLRGAGSDE